MTARASILSLLLCCVTLLRSRAGHPSITALSRCDSGKRAGFSLRSFGSVSVWCKLLACRHCVTPDCEHACHRVTSEEAVA